MHDDVIKWKHFPRYWPFVRGIHRSPVNSPHKGQWRGSLIFTLICVRINDCQWINNCEAGDLRRNRAHHDVIVMFTGDVYTFRTGARIIQHLDRFMISVDILPAQWENLFCECEPVERGLSYLCECGRTCPRCFIMQKGSFWNVPINNRYQKVIMTSHNVWTLHCLYINVLKFYNASDVLCSFIMRCSHYETVCTTNNCQDHVLLITFHNILWCAITYACLAQLSFVHNDMRIFKEAHNLVF